MIRQSKLSNGIRVLCDPHQDTRAVSLLVLVKAGSRHETESNNGVAHFVEHLMFKGTTKRPNTLVISQELDSVGADYNAYTSKDHTGYYIKVASAHLDRAIDLLADMLTDSVFDPKEVERERGTILEEINMYEDNPMAKIGDLFEERLFGERNALGRHIIGTPQTIRDMKRSQLVGFWRKQYHAGNMVIAVAGACQYANTVKMLERSFGSIRRGTPNKKPATRRSFPQASQTAFKKQTNQAHLMLGFPGVTYDDKNRIVLQLLSVILGGNMSSRLFIGVRERLGLCYFIRSGVDLYEDTGVFSIQAGLDLKNVPKALGAISVEIADIKKNGVVSAELTKAKEYMKGKLALSLEDSLEIASFHARQTMFRKKSISQRELISAVNRVTTEEIKRIAEQILNPKNAQLVTISPFGAIKHFAKHLDF